MANSSKPSPLVQTSFAAMVTPTSQFDTFAITHHFYATGGFKKADDATERLAITTARREADLTWVYQIDTGHWWALEGGDADIDWVDKGTSGPLDGASAASDVTYDNTASGLTATNVKAAIDEIESEKAPNNHTHDDRYYTESEVDTLLGNKANASETMDLTSEQTADGDKTFTGYVRAKRAINGDFDASFTLALGYADQRLFLVNTSGTDITITIPTNASVAFPIGTELEFVREGEGEVEFAGASGVTLNSANSLVSVGTQYAAVMLIKRAADSWILIGDLK